MSLQALVPVLVVDDNAAKRLALRSVLMPLGYHLVEADSGVAALRCVSDQEFAVILLDVRMPGMDGFETAALIRTRQQSETTPIIFITAYGTAEDIGADRHAIGPVDFMFAPVPPDELRAKVTVCAERYLKAGSLLDRAEGARVASDRAQQIVENLPIGVFRTDTEGRFVYTNPRWTELTGISAETALGQQWHGVIESSDPLHLVIGSSGAAPAGDRSQPLVIRRPDSTTQTVLATTRHVAAGDGQAAGWVGTLAPGDPLSSPPRHDPTTMKDQTSSIHVTGPDL